MPDPRRVVHYGAAQLEVQIPAASLARVIEPPSLHFSLPSVVVGDALNRPLTGMGWGQFRDRPGRFLVVVNDHARNTPTAEILAAIDFGVKKPDFLIAGGSHRPPGADELRRLFGNRHDEFAGRVHAHDATDLARLRFVGKTRRQTPVWLNELLFRYEQVLLVSSVEPHYFAGLMGGRKSFLPGLAGLETITANHRWALDPRARVLQLTGNPVHEDMMEAAHMVFVNAFSLQVVTDKEGRIFSAYAGDNFAAFKAAAVDCRHVYERAIDQPADIVVVVVQPPHDETFYRARRALEFARDAVRSGGITILVAACSKGLGRDEFTPVFAGESGPAAALERIARRFELGLQKPAKLCQALLHSRVWAKTELPDELLTKFFIRPVHDLNAALEDALRETGPSARILVIPDALAVIPLIPRLS